LLWLTLELIPYRYRLGAVPKSSVFSVDLPRDLALAQFNVNIRQLYIIQHYRVYKLLQCENDQVTNN